MVSDTKTRLLQTAAALFAENGYRGASVRRICDLARANPGAVSYHFGGKRQLYRTVLRRAAGALADLGLEDDTAHDEASSPPIAEVLERIVDRVTTRSTETRLLLRDLADGGEVAVEVLESTLRSAHHNLRMIMEEEIPGSDVASSREFFLDLAAPLFLLSAAWPVLQRALALEPEQRRELLASGCRRTLEAYGYGELG